MDQPPARALFRGVIDRVDVAFLQRVGWMGVAEVMARASRLVTVLAMAHWLTVEQFGLCALAVVLFDVGRVATQGGFAARIVTAEECSLAACSRGVARLNGVCHAGAALLLGFLAWPVERALSLPGLACLVWALLPAFLIYPWVALRVFHAHRHQQMRKVGLCSGLTICADNLLTAFGLWVGAGVYGVALGKAGAALLWLGLWLATSPAPPQGPCNRAQYRSLIAFGRKVIATELLKALRVHIDVMLAAVVLAPLQLGLYTFAKNAGVGLSQSLMNAYAVVVLPWIAEARRRGVSQARRMRQLALTTGGLCAVFGLQALAAFVYVPLLFDAEWHAATLLTAVLCLGAAPRVVLDTVAIWYRAEEQAGVELALVFTSVAIAAGLLAAAMLAGVLTSALAMAWATTVASVGALAAIRLTRNLTSPGGIFHASAATR